MIDSDKYLTLFGEVTKQLDKKLLEKIKIEVAVGEILDCVYLKLYKRSWASEVENPLTARSRVFFSIWVSDESIREQKLLYNIHAFKLRELRGYKIESRKFAERFRKRFLSVSKQWPNVSVEFGPLTLMEGWLKINDDNPGDKMVQICNQFLVVSNFIDDTLGEFKK